VDDFFYYQENFRILLGPGTKCGEEKEWTSKIKFTGKYEQKKKRKLKVLNKGK
jgi:hypothetical protein